MQNGSNMTTEVGQPHAYKLKKVMNMREKHHPET